MIEGIKILMAGQEYEVPPLSFNQIKRYWNEIQEYEKKTGIENMELTVKVAHAALTRNYPELTLEQVGDLVDLNNMSLVMEAVLGASGFFVRKGTPPQGPQIGT
jgi:hypothetical protein